MQNVHIITGIVMLFSVAIMIISGVLLGTFGIFFFWLGANDNACLTFIVGMRLLFLIPLGVGGGIIVIVSKKRPWIGYGLFIFAMLLQRMIPNHWGTSLCVAVHQRLMETPWVSIFVLGSAVAQ